MPAAQVAGAEEQCFTAENVASNGQASKRRFASRVRRIQPHDAMLEAPGEAFLANSVEDFTGGEAVAKSSLHRLGLLPAVDG